jgi:pimeloyl-ACP methyl ester carboxylesterase
MTIVTTTYLQHYRIRLALHQLRVGEGPALLLLHGLGEQSPTAVRHDIRDAWPGAIYALDFTGHGASTMAVAGGNSAEVLMADVDTVLAHLGEVSIYGRGLGAYVALLIAGARPALVRGIVLDDGPGMTGGPVGPTSATIAAPPPGSVGPPDPWAMVELANDIRPPDYALSYAHKAIEASEMANPIIVSAVARPPWLAAVVNEPGVRLLSVTDGLGYLARRGA